MSEELDTRSLEFDADNILEEDHARGLSDDEYNFEELQSGGDTTDEEGNRTNTKYPLFRMPSKMADYKWELGTFFATKEDFKEAIATYAIHSGRNLKIQKDDKKKVRVICKEGCNWLAFCTKLPTEDTWQLRKLVDNHSCSKEYKVRLLSSKWLSKKLFSGVRENPRIKLSDICDKAQEKWNTGVTKSKAYRAKRQAIDIVDGSFREQYLDFMTTVMSY